MATRGNHCPPCPQGGEFEPFLGGVGNLNQRNIRVLIFNMEEFKGKVFTFANKWPGSKISHCRMMLTSEKLNSGESLGGKGLCTSVGKEIN